MRALVLAAVCLGMPASAAEIVLSSPRLTVRLDGDTGEVLQVRNEVRGLDLVAVPGLAEPFTLQTSAGAVTPAGLTAVRDDAYPGEAWTLTWATSRAGVTVEGRIELPAGGDDVRFRARVLVTDPSLGVHELEYPVLAGIRRLVPAGGTDVALVPDAMGYLVTDPWGRLPSGLARRAYPDAYDGAAVQVTAYYREGAGGFSLEARDAAGTAKDFLFAKDPATGDLRWSVVTKAWDRRGGQGLDPGYEVRVAALTRGDWEEAADRYRAWAILQPWAARGRVADRPDAEVPRWLYEEVQAATFGVSINLDQARWFRALHDWVGGPLFHVSGFWWPGGTLASEWYGGYNDWSDGRVNPANLQAIREKGDRWAPFLFGNHFSRDASEWTLASGSDPVAPWQPYEMSPDPESAPWAYVCPATSTWPAFHGWRNVTVYDAWGGYDATYDDIGPGLGRVRCQAAGHGHPPGAGRWMVDAYRSMLGSRRGDLDARAGRRVGAGTELVSELYLGDVDYYQARAEASVLGMLEADAHRSAEKAGWKEKVPLFAYLYHDRGPVRLDGNLKAASQLGELFWWVAARVVAWGGLPELNYELSALEKFPSIPDRRTWYETYKSTFHVQDTTPYLSAAERGAFLGALGRARAGFARPYLAYGRMTRAPRVLSGGTSWTADWRLYNTFLRATDTSTGIETGPEYHETGTKAVDPLVRSGWDDDGRGLGLFLVNVQPSAAAVTLEVDPERHGLPWLNYALTRVEEGGATELGTLSGRQEVALTLPSRVPVLLEARPAACTAPSCLYRVVRESAPSSVQGAAPYAVATGHAWDEPSPDDGIDRYYLVDDGAGRPTFLKVEKPGGGVRLEW